MATLAGTARRVSHRMSDLVYQRPVARHIRELERFARLDPDQVALWQSRRLAEILEHAYRHVPHYRRVIDEAGLGGAVTAGGRAGASTGWAGEILPKLPILTKAVIREEFPLGITSAADVAATRPVALHTSGSTQVPLTVYRDRRLGALERATRLWFATRSGLRRGDRVAYLSHLQLPQRSLPGKVWGGLSDVVVLPKDPLLEGDIERTARAFEALRPDALSTVGPLLALFVHGLVASGRALRHRPKAVFYTASMLQPGLGTLAARVFGAPVLSLYGAVETGIVAQTCLEWAARPDGPPATSGGQPATPGEDMDGNEHLHINARRFLIEVVDQSGRPAPPETTGRLLVTDLGNRVMPFIRYDIGDAGWVDPRPCSCGSGLPVLGAISGRTEDFVVRPSGRRVLLGVLYRGIHDEMMRWKTYQFEQTARDRLTLSIVPDRATYTPDELRRLAEKVEEVAGEPGDQVTVTVRVVDDIPFEASGKRPFLKRT